MEHDKYFVRAGSPSSLASGAAKVLEVDGVEVLLVNLGGSLYAVENECSHRGCMLSDGEIAGHEAACPCHGAVFDIRSGAVLAGPTSQALRTFTVRIVNGQIEVGPR